MRLAVAGKGGAGKTTIAATLARLLARAGYRVNALDDDPNPNLAVALGLPPADVERLRRVPQEEVMDERVDDQGRVSLHLTRPLEQVVDQFGAHGPDGVDVLTMIGVLGAGKGCICGQHVAVRSLVGEIGQARPDDVTIVDMEASLEHLGRATVGTADVLLLVAEPYFRSLETVGRIVPLARELGVPHLAVVANKVRSPRDEAAIREHAARHEVEVVGVVPFDESVTAADSQGRALIDAAPDAPAVAALRAVADRLVERFAAPAGSR